MITFQGSVKIATKDGLKVNTEAIVFNQTSEIAQTDAPISFTRENISGKSIGAVVDGKNKGSSCGRM